VGHCIENDCLIPAECEGFIDRGINSEVLDDNTSLDVPNNKLASINTPGCGVSMDADMGKKPMEWFSLPVTEATS